MRFLKKSERKNPKVSLVLLDWSVRESFHLLHYLSKQNVERSDFEVIIIEYYSRVSDAIHKFEDQVDTWIVMDMPENCYYHKHLMYNVGIVVSNGDIVMIGDSDAMVKDTFIDSIIKNFQNNRKLAYHMDEFRNMRRDLYPFNYPSFEEVLGEGCINNVQGKTAGVLNTEDPIHSRNYGACMCATRDDLISIGGADEHLDYLGHICGPYDMTFRLVNYGCKELWDMDQFLYHTWHPGQAGADNYMGPHDGRHMSSTALEAMESGRVFPLLENRAIRLLRTGDGKNTEDVLDKLIDPGYLEAWDVDRLKNQGSITEWSDYKRDFGFYKGFHLVAEVDRVLAYPLTDKNVLTRSGQGHRAAFEGLDLEEVKQKINHAIPFIPRVIFKLFLSGDSRSAAIALYSLKKWEDRDQDNALVVIADSVRMSMALKMLAVLGLIQKQGIQRISDAEDMVALMNKIREGDHSKLYVVGKGLFQQCLGIVSEDEVPDDVVVI